MEERPKGRRAIVWCDPKSFKVDSLFVDGFSEKRNVTEGTLDLKRGDIVYVTKLGAIEVWSVRSEINPVRSSGSA